MATFKSFEEMDAWQTARSLAKEIYQLTRKRDLNRDFALVDQLRRASISIMANIAEGFERNGTREFIQFLSQAKGSAGELQSHLYILLDQDFITADQFASLHGRIRTLGRLLGALIQYLRRSTIRGSKFQDTRLQKTPQPQPETRNRQS